MEYLFEPTDALGLSIGEPVLLDYTSLEDLQEQLTRLHAELRRKVVVEADSPADASQFPTMDEFPVLTDEEKKALKADLLSPFDGKADAARAKLAESAHNELRRKAAEETFEALSMAALETFKANNPDFYRCSPNARAIVNYVAARNLDPTDVKNLQKAYDVLRKNGVLLERPAR